MLGFRLASPDDGSPQYQQQHAAPAAPNDSVSPGPAVSDLAPGGGGGQYQQQQYPFPSYYGGDGQQQQQQQSFQQQQQPAYVARPGPGSLRKIASLPALDMTVGGSLAAARSVPSPLGSPPATATATGRFRSFHPQQQQQQSPPQQQQDQLLGSSSAADHLDATEASLANMAARLTLDEDEEVAAATTAAGQQRADGNDSGLLFSDGLGTARATSALQSVILNWQDMPNDSLHQQQQHSDQQQQDQQQQQYYPSSSSSSSSTARHASSSSTSSSSQHTPLPSPPSSASVTTPPTSALGLGRLPSSILDPAAGFDFQRSHHHQQLQQQQHQSRLHRASTTLSAAKQLPNPFKPSAAGSADLHHTTSLPSLRRHFNPTSSTSTTSNNNPSLGGTGSGPRAAFAASATTVAPAHFYPPHQFTSSTAAEPEPILTADDAHAMESSVAALPASSLRPLPPHGHGPRPTSMIFLPPSIGGEHDDRESAGSGSNFQQFHPPQPSQHHQPQQQHHHPQLGRSRSTPFLGRYAPPMSPSSGSAAATGPGLFASPPGGASISNMGSPAGSGSGLRHSMTMDDDFMYQQHAHAHQFEQQQQQQHQGYHPQQQQQHGGHHQFRGGPHATPPASQSHSQASSPPLVPTGQGWGQYPGDGADAFGHPDDVHFGADYQKQQHDLAYYDDGSDLALPPTPPGSSARYSPRNGPREIDMGPDAGGNEFGAAGAAYYGYHHDGGSGALPPQSPHHPLEYNPYHPHQHQLPPSAHHHQQYAHPPPLSPPAHQQQHHHGYHPQQQHQSRSHQHQQYQQYQDGCPAAPQRYHHHQQHQQQYAPPPPGVPYPGAPSPSRGGYAADPGFSHAHQTSSLGRAAGARLAHAAVLANSNRPRSFSASASPVPPSPPSRPPIPSYVPFYPQSQRQQQQAQAQAAQQAAQQFDANAEQQLPAISRGGSPVGSRPGSSRGGALVPTSKPKPSGHARTSSLGGANRVLVLANLPPPGTVVQALGSPTTPTTPKAPALMTVAASTSPVTFVPSQSPIAASLVPSLQALGGWAATRIHHHALKLVTSHAGTSAFPSYLSILGGDNVEFQFGFPPAPGSAAALSAMSGPGGMGLGSGSLGKSAGAAAAAALAAQQQLQLQAQQQQQHHPNTVAFVLVEQVALGARAVELHVPTCTSAPNHLLSWTTVYAANSFGIYRLTPLQAHVLPLFVRPLVQYSERIINKEKMPHLVLAVGEGGAGKTWSYLLGCIDYIVRGSHFQRGGQQQNQNQQQGNGQQQGQGDGRGRNNGNNNAGGAGPKAVILLPTKEAVVKMRNLLAELATAITNSWMKSQDIACTTSPGGGSPVVNPGSRQQQQPQQPQQAGQPPQQGQQAGGASAAKPHRLVSYIAILGNILKTRLVKQLNDHDIIVSTPNSLRQVVEANRLRLDNIKYFVLDEITRVHEAPSLHQLADDVAAVVARLPVSTKQHPIKLVLFSRHWNNNVQFLTERIAGVFRVVPPTMPANSSNGAQQHQQQAAAHADGTPAGTRASSPVLPTGPAVPATTTCESYLKIVVCPKAFPNTLFPRPCLVPFARHVFRCLAHIPHHFIRCPRGQPGAKLDTLLDVLMGEFPMHDPALVDSVHGAPVPPQYAHQLVAQQQPAMGRYGHHHHHHHRAASVGIQSSARGGGGYHHQQQQLPPLGPGFIVLVNSRHEAIELHSALIHSPIARAVHLVLPETLESTLAAVRNGAFADLHAHHQYQHQQQQYPTYVPQQQAGFGVPWQQQALQASGIRIPPPLQQQPGVPVASPSSSASSPLLGHSASGATSPTPAAVPPALVLITVRPDPQAAGADAWMPDLKAVAHELSYTIVNYTCPAAVDDYYLSLLTYVTPNVATGVDVSLKVALSPNKVPLRMLPVALVTLFAGELPAPAGSAAAEPAAVDESGEDAEDAAAPGGDATTSASASASPTAPVAAGPMAVSEYMPTTEADRVAVYRNVAKVITESR
ncbi:hypothetical protein H9P43_001902 [Blastocladiella emersonii ATCC 22665]|nr:hypothetical protein H9P43_001902 [Blastocladiella emersonii ATCC 22665]